MKNKKIIRTVTSITGILIIGKLFGFAKQIFVASRFGTTIETDIVSVCEGVIGGAEAMLINAIITCFTAVYIHVKEKEELRAAEFSGNTVKAFTLISLVPVAAIMLFSGPLARLVAPSYSPQNSAALASCLFWMAPVLILFCWGAIFQAFLNANEKFAPCQFTSINISVITVLVVIFLGSRIGAKALLAGIALYALYNVLFLGFFTRRIKDCTGIRMERGNPFRDENIKNMLLMSLPILVSCSMEYVNTTMSKMILSGMVAGTVTAVNYAVILYQFVSTAITAVSSVLFTYITAAIAANDDTEAIGITRKSAFMVSAVLLPVSIVTWICAPDIVSICFERGAFNSSSVAITANALRGYAFVFVPATFREIYSRYLYGRKDTKTPMITSCIGICINLGLCIVLSKALGVFGVALAGSLATAVTGVLNMIGTKKYSGQNKLKPDYGVIINVFIACAVCIVAAKLCSRWLISASHLGRFAAVTACAMASYGLCLAPQIKKYIKTNPFVDKK